MSFAVATAVDSAAPSAGTASRQHKASIATGLVVLTLFALAGTAERGAAASCGGTQLTVADLSLPGPVGPA